MAKWVTPEISVDAGDKRTAVKRAQSQVPDLIEKYVPPVEPDPEPDPEPPQPEPMPEPEPEDAVPTGTFYRADPMTDANMNYNGAPWGQWSREARSPGSSGSGQIEFRNDGPLIDGTRHNCRRIGKPAGDRRNEIGQVNNDDGFVYPVGSEAVTRTWHRVPTDYNWAAAEDNRSNLMQMKHSANLYGSQPGSAGAYYGYGGEPLESAPPLSLKQFAGGVELVERSGDYNGRSVWQHPVPHMKWWEIIYHIDYSLTGHVDLYFRLEGEAPKLVLSKDMPTVKLNRDRKPMHSTYRVGLYTETFITMSNDVGPVRVERLG